MTLEEIIGQPLNARLRVTHPLFPVIYAQVTVLSVDRPLLQVVISSTLYPGLASGDERPRWINLADVLELAPTAWNPHGND